MAKSTSGPTGVSVAAVWHSSNNMSREIPEGVTGRVCVLSVVPFSVWPLKISDKNLPPLIRASDACFSSRITHRGCCGRSRVEVPQSGPMRWRCVRCRVRVLARGMRRTMRCGVLPGGTDLPKSNLYRPVPGSRLHDRADMSERSLR